MATVINISITRGDDATLEANITDDDGEAVDITGYDVEFSVKRHPLDTTSFISCEVGSGITLSDPAAGQLQIDLTSAQTTLPLGKYYYDIQTTNLAGKIQTPIKGVLTVLYDVTR